MKIPKDKIEIWIDALRSGKYKQGNKSLQPSKNEYCCLGVACKIFIDPKKIRLDDLNLIFGGLPYHQENSPEWLNDLSDDFLQKTDVKIFHLNDHGLLDEHGNYYENPLSFNEIADLLQAVYVEEVLK